MIALKKILKFKKINYSQLASKISLSESSVKRIFTSKDGPFGRIEQICEAVGINFYDLVKESQDVFRFQSFEFTPKQEKFFLKNINHFYFFIQIFTEQMDIKEMKERNHLSDKSLFSYLLDLEKIGLLELYPKNKYKFLVSGNLSLEMSPLAKKLTRDNLDWMAVKVCEKDVTKDSKNGVFINRQIYLTQKGLDSFVERYENLYLELLNTAQREEKIYPENKLFPIAYFFGLFKGDFSNKKIPNLTQNLLTKGRNHQMSL